MIWSNDLAYVVGLITADGSLSSDGRHLDFTSKDLELVLTFERILKTKNRIGIKRSPSHNGREYFRVQFSDVKLYKFLLSIGLHPHKSTSLTQLAIPDQFFADFLRGCFDGDGFTYSYWDKRWRSSFMFYSGLTSASSSFLLWVKNQIERLFEINGTIKPCGKSAYQLMFAKQNSLLLMKKMYYYDRITCLSRKKFKIDAALDIINKQAQVAKW